ncbi:hypothetical protein COT87_01705, partial [Candidatus Collierbacteria bacterium CG10_big_fil_rev_8_21_14_0_10_44_9]
AQLQDLSCYFGNILEAIIPLIGIISFIMILVGGFKILTSAGDPKGMAGGKQTITLAIVGIILAIVSWLILVLIENITGVDVTKFNFGFK